MSESESFEERVRIKREEWRGQAEGRLEREAIQK